MDRLNLLTMGDYGIIPKGIRSFKVDSVIHGRGPDRLKYLDLEGHWKLNGQSVLCITSAFNHLERLNDAKNAFRIFSDEPLNAIGIIGLKPSRETKPASKPLLVIEETTPAVTREKEKSSPPIRETLPHRSAGYGQAHQERKLTVPDRSRSSSPNVDINSNKSKDFYGTKERKRWESGKIGGDLGYASSEERYGTKSPFTERPPHRTQALSPRIESSHRKHDSEYNPYSFYNRDRAYDEGLTISVKETTRQPPYRISSDTISSRQFDISPKSLPSDYSSASEQASPYTNRNIDDVVVTTYHMTKTTRREQQTPPHRTAIY